MERDRERENQRVRGWQAFRETCNKKKGFEERQTVRQAIQQPERQKVSQIGGLADIEPDMLAFRHAYRQFEQQR